MSAPPGEIENLKTTRLIPDSTGLSKPSRSENRHHVQVRSTV